MEVEVGARLQCLRFPGHKSAVLTGKKKGDGVEFRGKGGWVVVLGLELAAGVRGACT